ncbi:MAG: NADH-quinone oxidoreductase subunit L, partial [Pseudorhodobacter sp.]|nr:NADH-quinone oxidoreductase subunit L [Pseudorhodobacter sp.]
ALMTSFYSWRLMFMTFYGAPRGDAHAHDHAHESPKTMLIPLGVLALGAAFSGMVWYNSFFGDVDKMQSWFGMETAQHEGGEAHAAAPETATATAPETASTETAAPETSATEAPAAGNAAAAGHAATPPATAPKGAVFFGPDNHTIHEAHEVAAWVKVSPFIAMLVGFIIAYVFYIRSPDLPGRLAAQQRPLYLFLLNKWYFDELYDFVFVRGGNWVGRFLWKRGDVGAIDGTIDGVALGLIPRLTRFAGRVQSGYLFHYAFAMVLGVVALVTWMTMAGGAP